MGPRGHRQPWWFSGRTRPAIVLGAPTCCSGGIPGRISQGKAGGRGPGKPGAGCRGASCSAPAVPSHRTARLPDSKWSQARETLPVREARWRRSARGFVLWDDGECGQSLAPTFRTRGRKAARHKPRCCPRLGAGPLLERERWWETSGNPRSQIPAKDCPCKQDSRPTWYVGSFLHVMARVFKAHLVCQAPFFVYFILTTTVS